jgi:hypothetical protein
MPHTPRHLFCRLATCLITIGLLATVADDATARPRPAGQSKSFSANKTFGLGLMLGAPSGLSGKYFLDSSHALDFGIGALGYYRGRDGLHLHADYLWHPVSLVSADAFELPLYFGIGARLFDFSDKYADQTLALGLRAPIGIAFDLNRTPLDIFVEFALVADLYVNYRDRLGIDVNGAIGIRYWFK